MQNEANCPNCGSLSRLSALSGTAYCQSCQVEFLAPTFFWALRVAFRSTATQIDKSVSAFGKFCRGKPLRIAVTLFGLAFIGYAIEQPRHVPTLFMPFETTSYVLTRAGAVLAVMAALGVAVIPVIFFFNAFSELRKRGFLSLVAITAALLTSITVAILSQIAVDHQLVNAPKPEVFRRPPTERGLQIAPPSNPVRYTPVRSSANDLPLIPLDEIPADIQKANMEAYRSQIWQRILPHLQKMRDCELRNSRGAFEFEYSDAVIEAERCKVFSPQQYVQESYAKLTGHSALAILKSAQ